MSGPVFSILHHVDGDPAERPIETVYAEVLEHVEVAEEAGFDLVWFAEHRGAPRAGQLPAPWIFIAHAAARARRIQFGTAVTLLPYHHPLAVAEQVATADRLTGGRVVLGIGSGATPADFAAFGVDAATKHARLREGLTILRDLWTGQPVTFHGEHYHVENARLTPTASRPARDFVWLAAGGAAAGRVAGEFDLHLLLGRGTPLHEAREIVAAYDEARQAHGHTAPDRFVQRTWLVYVDDTIEAARATIEPSARHYAAGGGPGGQRAVPVGNDLDALLDRLDMIVGDPETVAAALAQRIHDYRLTHVTIHTRLAALSHETTLRSTRLLGAEVLPRVRQLLRDGLPANEDAPLATARR